eukprot:scaffold159419_cov62-Cyclotella_meneghiniana.AAC.4
MTSLNNKLDDTDGNTSFGKSVGKAASKKDSRSTGILKSGEIEIDGGDLTNISMMKLGGATVK